MADELKIGKAACQLCGNYEDHDLDFEQHKSTNRHWFNWLLYEFNKHKKVVVRDRDGIIVTLVVLRDTNILTDTNDRKGSYTLKLSPERFEELQRTLKVQVRVENNSKHPVHIIFTILHPYSAFSFESNLTVLLAKGESYTNIVKFKLDVSIVGSIKLPIAITAQPQNAKDATKYLTIYREIAIFISGEHQLEEEDKKNSPFQCEPWGIVEQFIGPTDSPRRLNCYPIPEELGVSFMNGLKFSNSMNTNQVVALKKALATLKNGLTQNNYAEFFHYLLWLDEVGAMLGLSQYNMTNVTMDLLRKELLELKVPGLAEKRPSVIVGDLVNIRIHNDHTAYQGVVTCVNDASIYIKNVNKELLLYLSEYPDVELDVSFEFSRLQHERMHKGVDMCKSNLMMLNLFPVAPLFDNIKRIQLDRNSLINKSIMGNPQQKTAVENIISGTSLRAPYIVFGPPGTGKTITIVEAILQIKQRFKGRKILICAPANAACDMLTSKLKEHCTDDELIRVHSSSRDVTQIPNDIKRFSNLEGLEFREIKAGDLKNYTIVITTLHFIGKFAEQYSPDYLFIDEAAQATEPECDIPIGLLSPNKQIVLAGDPKQLGPICTSKLAERYGLSTSLLERLMNTIDLYQPLHQNPLRYNTNYLTMLIRNYRSHQDIIYIPNKLFYNGSLETIRHSDPISNVFVSQKVFGNTGKRNQKVPGLSIEFCGVISKEQRNGTSPSYYNESELQMVMKFVAALMSYSDIKVKQTDIGIISPYIRQVHRIKNKLKERSYEDIEVGTTEAFQGREKRIMIISTVRAQHSLLRYDHKYNLGFVKNDRRFNVALTRAQSKLIIIGNPFCLGYDEKCWGNYIEWCQDNDAYFGIHYQPRTELVQNDIIRRIQNTKWK